MKAVKRFDTTHGVRLVSFAVHWIKAEIHEYVLRNWRIVKVATTKAQRKLFFNLRSAKKRLGWFNHEEVEAVAEAGAEGDRHGHGLLGRLCQAQPTVGRHVAGRGRLSTAGSAVQRASAP